MANFLFVLSRTSPTGDAVFPVGQDPPIQRATGSISFRPTMGTVGEFDQRPERKDGTGDCPTTICRTWSKTKCRSGLNSLRQRPSGRRGEVLLQHGLGWRPSSH